MTFMGLFKFKVVKLVYCNERHKDIKFSFTENEIGVDCKWRQMGAEESTLKLRN